jgi:hypothetical protein
VPDDRFADLGPPERERQSAAERFEELDRSSPEPDMPRSKPSDARRTTGRYTWVVGVVFLIVVVIGGANALNNAGGGFKGLVAGKPLPVFAAPLTSSGHDNDVNVQRRSSGGVPAACDVRLPGVVTLCQLRGKPLVITFIANGGSRRCAAQLDVLDRVRSSFPGVQFLGVISNKPLADAKAIVHSHGWKLPVALDRDHELFNLYAIGDCPTTVFGRPNGRSAGTRHPALTEAQLRAHVRALVAGRPLPP